MNLHEMANLVTIWFNKALAGGLILPDGWFGRPHDNLHRLSRVQALGQTLQIELDDRLVLEFTNPASIRIKDSALIIEGFDNLSFYWSEFDSDDKHTTAYTSGTVRFMPPTGTVVN